MVPSGDDFTRKERRIISVHKTPSQVQRYLNSLPYNTEPQGGTLRSFRGVVAKGRAHCLEAALSAAAILEQHGYPVQLLDLQSQDQLDHVLYLYRKGGKWGTVGRSRDPGLHGRKPVFRWKVEQHLRDMPHKRFARADPRYRYWHERYQAYRRRYPDRKPLYYDNKRTRAPGYPRGKG